MTGKALSLFGRASCVDVRARGHARDRARALLDPGNRQTMRFPFGTLLVVLGIALVVAGLLANTGLLSWFGRLPGDIRVERGSTRVYIPIVSMLIVSVVLSLLLALFRRIR
jgi:hypothetical protein